MTERDAKFMGGGRGISGPYDVTTFLIFLHKTFSLKHVLGHTQHVHMMIISNHANPPPCFIQQLGEVPFVDMVFMHEIVKIKINCLGLFRIYNQAQIKTRWGNLCKKCDVQGGGGSAIQSM